MQVRDAQISPAYRDREIFERDYWPEANQFTSYFENVLCRVDDLLSIMVQTTSVQDETLEELERITSFQLDVIDLFLSKYGITVSFRTLESLFRRIRIVDVGPFYNFGHPIGFYALNERAVVIVDYERVNNRHH